MTQFLEHWTQFAAGILETIRSRLQPADAAKGIPTLNLRPALSASASASGNPDLLTFLKTESDAAPDALNIVVAGHSKGGALAPALALWLEEARASGAAAERWDTKGSAQVSCYAFAGTHAGQRGLRRPRRTHAGRALSASSERERHRHARLAGRRAARDPGLYGARSKVLDPLIGVDCLTGHSSSATLRHRPSCGASSASSAAWAGPSAFSSSTSTWRPISRRSGSPRAVSTHLTSSSSRVGARRDAARGLPPARDAAAPLIRRRRDPARYLITPPSVAGTA